jgi:WD40 repeat protein
VWRTGDGQLVGGYAHEDGALAWSADGRLLATSDGSTVDVCREDRTIAATYAAHGVAALAFSPDGRFLAGGNDAGGITLWPLGTDPLEPPGSARTMKGHEGRAHSVCFSPDGLILASAGSDGIVMLWPVDGGSEPRRIEAHSGAATSVAFSPDGHTLFSAGSDVRWAARWAEFGTIKLWRLEDGAHLKTIDADRQRVRSLSVHANGELLLAGGTDGVRLWRVSDGSARFLTREWPRRMALSGDLAVVATPDTQWIPVSEGGVVRGVVQVQSGTKFDVWRLHVDASRGSALVSRGALPPPVTPASSELSGLLWRRPAAVDESSGGAAFLTVRFESEDGSVVREATSDVNGHYRLSLPAGRYKVTTSHPGFDRHGEGSSDRFYWVPAGGFNQDIVFAAQ